MVYFEYDENNGIISVEKMKIQLDVPSQFFKHKIVIKSVGNFIFDIRKDIKSQIYKIWYVSSDNVRLIG